MTKTIVLACSAGMSTSMLVTKLRKSAEKKGYDYHIYAVPTSELPEELVKEDISGIFLGPQVAFQKDTILDLVKDKDIHVEVINMMDYGTMNADKIIEQIKSVVE